METTTQFPVDTGNVVEVTCSNSEAVKKGSSEITCKTGTIFTFLEEPSCSLPGLKVLLSDEALYEAPSSSIRYFFSFPGIIIPGIDIIGELKLCGVFFVPGIELLHYLILECENMRIFPKFFKKSPNLASHLYLSEIF